MWTRVLPVLLTGCGWVGLAERGPSDPDAAAIADAPAADADPVASGLLVWLPMDDDPGDGVDNRGTASDRATCSSTCPDLTSAVRGGGLEFDGIDDALRVADDVALHLPTGTLAAWVRPRVAPVAGFQMFLAKPFGPTSANSWECFFQALTPLVLGVGGDGGAEAYLGTAWVGGVGTWVHVAFTWTASASALHVDGVVVSTGTGLVPAYDAHPLVVGADEDDGVVDQFFQGALDDVRIYDRALTAAEVAVLATP